MSPDAAKTWLVRTGRAVADGEGINADLGALDSVGLGALQIHMGGEPDTLSSAMERATGRVPSLSPAVLGRIAHTAAELHAETEPPVAQAA